MTQFNCTRCGATLTPAIATSRMATCASCGTTHVIEDDAVRRAGEAGVLHDMPLLFRVGEEVTAPQGTFRAIGQVRYSYGRGIWDEFWCVDGVGEGAWISLDEGDVVVQRPVTPGDAGPPGHRPTPGETVQWRGSRYTVTEAETATCLAFAGELPEVMTVGEEHAFLNCTGSHTTLLSIEYGSQGTAWFVGDWIDPYTIVTPPR